MQGRHRGARIGHRHRLLLSGPNTPVAGARYDFTKPDLPGPLECGLPGTETAAGWKARSMKVVIALGGNALLKRGERLESDVQRQNVARAAEAIAAIARQHKVIVTHGNGPQVGLLAMLAESYSGIKPYPLDVLGAESEGMIGYLIEQELRSLMPGRHIVTLLTQTEVNRADAAFRRPSKPIGPGFEQQEAERLADERGWTIAKDGSRWRRVVPSPEPLRILELGAIRLLSDAGVLVVCAGGGGIPVTVSPTGAVRGVEAVIDKDLAAALLAHQVGADALLLLTDVGSVYANWKEKNAQPILDTTPAELRQHNFAAGSMRPKVEAACRFIESGGSFAGIGLIEEAGAILLGQRGTRVRRPESTLDFTNKGGNIDFADASPPEKD